jgi:D-sedoheptulose 7-phosphate isomerase
MDAPAVFDRELEDHRRVLEATFETVRPAFAGVCQACADTIRAGGKLLLFGNGGSAADAQHIATELTVRYSEHRAPIAAIALTTDTSTLTATANDLGYEEVFSRQVAALGRSGDLAVAISTSGRSVNVVAGLHTARQLGLRTVAFTGAHGGPVAEAAEQALMVPSAVTSRTQEMHITLGHVLCSALEQELGLVGSEAVESRGLRSSDQAVR